jgi:hypothetical protein
MKEYVVGCFGAILATIAFGSGWLLVEAIWDFSFGRGYFPGRDDNTFVPLVAVFLASSALAYWFGRELDLISGKNKLLVRGRFPLDAKYPPNWEEVRQVVLKRDGYQCGNCGSTENLHVHHIVPLSLGGSNELGNLRTLCKTCHAKLHPHMRN